MMQETTPKKYGSCEKVDPGQMKRLLLAAGALIPVDIPSGFAQELIDGKLKEIITEGIKRQRALWRKEQFYFEFAAHNFVRVDKGGCLADRLASQKDQNSMSYVMWDQGTEKTDTVSGTVQRDLTHPPTGQTDSFFYYMTPVSRDSILELLGGADGIYSGGWALNPLQVFYLIHHGIIAYDGKTPYLFLMGCYKRMPIFLRAWREDGGPWRLCQEGWAYPENGADKAYIVLRRKLPKPS